jgi:DNA-binding beta-propeller fold protein YncE
MRLGQAETAEAPREELRWCVSDKSSNNMQSKPEEIAMCRHVLRASGLALALLTLPLFSFVAAAQIAVSANDNKAVFINGVNTVPPNPADDTVTVIDLGVSPPNVIGELKAPNSVIGPPQNVAITPDESLALVASNQKRDPADATKLVPDNRVSVIDLKAKPPAVIATVVAGLGPAGIGINRAGTLALVANRNDGTVSILTISGKTVTVAGAIDFGNPKSGPSSAAFSPNGKMALVTRDGDNKISILSVDGANVTDTKKYMVGDIRPYAIAFTPKGDAAIVGNQGGGMGDIDTINVIDAKGKLPRIVHTLDVGEVVEGLAISNDGKYVALVAINGSNKAADFPFYNDHSLVVVFRINRTNLSRVADVNIGKLSQGVVWSRDGKTLLAQNFIDRTISILKFDGKNLFVTGEIKVSGGPAGLRTAEH